MKLFEFTAKTVHTAWHTFTGMIKKILFDFVFGSCIGLVIVTPVASSYNVSGILRNPDSKKTWTKRKPGLVKNPDSSLRKAGLAIRKAGFKIDKNGIRNWIQNCKAL